MYNKCNTKMDKLTEIYTIRFTKNQVLSLKKLKKYDVDVSNFIRIAIREKIAKRLERNKRKKRTGETPVLIKKKMIV